MKFLQAILLGGLILALAAVDAQAATYFGPTPYLSALDIPTGLYAAGPTALETFEDGSLDFGISATSGGVGGPGAFTDSVDGDDGVIDGFGTQGKSWATNLASTSMTFSFSGPLPSAAGIVWTDSDPNPLSVSFEAFGPGMVSLGIFGPFQLGDTVQTGTTAEDRFFGVSDSGGILAIRLYNTSTNGWEIDHLQYGAEWCPSRRASPSATLGLIGFVGWGWRRKRSAPPGALTELSSAVSRQRKTISKQSPPIRSGNHFDCAGAELIDGADDFQFALVDKLRHDGVEALEPADAPLDVGFDDVVQFVAGSAFGHGDGGLDQVDKLADGSWQRVVGIDVRNRGFYRSALAVPQDHNQSDAELGNRVLNASLYDRASSDDLPATRTTTARPRFGRKQVRRNARVRAADDRCKGSLPLSVRGEFFRRSIQPG